jgi:hypothetical protein
VSEERILQTMRIRLLAVELASRDRHIDGVPLGYQKGHPTAVVPAQAIVPLTGQGIYERWPAAEMRANWRQLGSSRS